MNEPIEQQYALWDQFLEHFPLEKIESMSLEEYSQVGSKDSFTWWVESGLDTLGSIWGSTSFKFGIYARKNTDKVFKKKQYKSDDQYAWQAKYGETSEEAFSAVKSVIIKIAEAAPLGDLESIDQADLSPNYKWKLAHLYQDRKNPTVLNIFTKEVLAHFLQAKTGITPPKLTLAHLYREIMRLRNNQDLLEFGDVVWKEGTIQKAYAKIKTDFLKHFPGFSTFTNPTESYLQEERNYKQELCTIYAQELAPRLHPLTSNEEDLLQLGKDISALFGRKLFSDNAPQNLVGWRYSEFAKKMDEKGHIDFAKAVSRLTDPTIGLDVRIPDFIDFLHQHSADGKCGQAATRSLTTFFLFLSDPKIHFFIKTEEVGKLLKLFNLDKFNNDSLAPEEYSRVQRLAGEICQLLVEDGLAPHDMIDVQSFVWSALHVPTENEQRKTGTGTTPPYISLPENIMTSYPLNQILYGPPGTGKTYKTAERAVKICDGSSPADRVVLMQRYRELIAEKRISFVSFHQSFSYEEFIEGIRPELTVQADSEHEQLIYKVEDGLFKKICSLARTAVDDLQRPKTTGIDLKGRKFYKMSVGGKYHPEVESYCFENDYLAMGWGGDVDFSKLPKDKDWEPARDAIKQLMTEQGSEHADKRFAIQALFWFKNYVDVGDIIIVPKGLSQIQAIGQVTGEYEYRPDLLPGEGYQHFRTVKWLIRDAAIPVEKVWAKQFSQQSIYSLPSGHLNMDYLEKLLGGSGDAKQTTEAERYVLIIDEINRANISKVLGELITLIEPDKRLGMINEITVKLPYSREEFGIPPNLHIVGTMNTADRSLALMDTALRRRFEFEEMMPNYTLLAGIEIGEIKIDELLQKMNQRIEALYDREHTIGHAFFMPLKEEPSIDNLASIFAHKIIPLLAEYFFEDWQKIRLVLGDNQKTDRPETQFIFEEELENNGSVLFGNSIDLAMYGLDRLHQYVRNEDALTDPDAYVGIYNSAALKEE
jgi:5-methylcytosine-specific restriction endonuclease McrBC GTP-binding regulatory subunit McrB